jgi:ATP:ADP antiporter, AAA family
MLTVAERLLGLNARELRRALPLFAYLFLTMAASVASRAARDALFLDRFSPLELPYVDIAIALLVAVVASLYIRVGLRTNLRNLQVGSLLVFSASAAGFWWLSQGTADEGGTLFVVIYIWVGVFSVLAPAQVWTLANYTLTTREAKRAFGLVGSGAILGWIVGGLATRESAGRFGTESMLLLVAGTLLLCAGLVVWIWRGRPSYVDQDEPASRPPESGESGGMHASLSMLRESPYLRAIAALICLSALATTVAGWQFKAVAKANIPDTDQLAEFFGSFNVIAGIVSFVLQLTLTGRLLKQAGVGVAIFIVPAALVVSSLGLLATGTLLAAAALKASDQVLRYSIDKSTVELLYLPVPASLTFRAKSFIDTVVYRMGDALGGVTILLFGALLGLDAIQMSWVCLVLLGGWAIAAMQARRQYGENLRDSIHQHRVDVERAATPVIERSTAELLATYLTGTQEQVLYALRLLENSRDTSLHPGVRELLRHESARVRSRALALLARAGDASVATEVERLLYDPDLSVRTEALLYLSELAHVDPLERIEKLGDFPDFSIRAGMAAYLARPGRTQNLDAARLILNAMARETGASGLRTRAESARLIGMLPDHFDHELRLLLQDESPEVVREAIRAVGKLGKRTFIARVVDRLGEPEFAAEAITALVMFGDRVVGTMRDYLTDKHTAIEIRREIPTVLLAIESAAAQAVLTEGVLDRDAVVRYRVITALNKLGQSHPERQMDRASFETVLAAEIIGHYRSQQMLGAVGIDGRGDPVLDELRKASGHEEERIFRLLKLVYPDHDLHSAYVGLQSSDPVVYDNALEFLETILAPGLRAVLIPLFDRQVTLLDRKTASPLSSGSSVQRMEILRTMMMSDNTWLQSCAAYVIGELRIVQFGSALDQWVGDPDPLLQSTAIDARDKLRRAVTSGAGTELR